MVKLSRKVLCLDWDARMLRLVVARVGGGSASLEDAHAHRLPPGLDVGNAQALGEFIQQTLKRHRWRHTRALVNVPREKAVINRLTMPPTPMHEVAAAVRFQAMKELPFPLDSAVVDYVVMRRDERGLATEVLLAAVPLEALGAIQATCAAAGLEAVRIGLRPQANLVSVQQLSGMADRRVLFVDVGPTMTEIDMMAGGQLAFARSAGVTLPPPAGEADSPGPTVGESADAPAGDEALEGAIRELVLEVTRTLQAYRATEPEANIDHVLIAGGTGVEPPLLAAVAQRLKLPVSLFDPVQALRAKRADAVKLRSFSAALGLAWGLSREGALAIDFLNPKQPVARHELLKRRIKLGVAVAAGLAAMALGADLTLYFRESGKLALRQKEINRLREDLRQYVELENLVEQVGEWQFDAIWPEHLRQISELAVPPGHQPGQEMLVQQLALDARTATVAMKKVLATSWKIPSDFVARLNAFEQDGTHPYRAALGSWSAGRGRDTKFPGGVDVRVELLELKQHMEASEAREKARKAKVRGL